MQLLLASDQRLSLYLVNNDIISILISIEIKYNNQFSLIECSKSLLAEM